MEQLNQEIVNYKLKQLTEEEREMFDKSVDAHNAYTNLLAFAASTQVENEEESKEQLEYVLEITYKRGRLAELIIQRFYDVVNND